MTTTATQYHEQLVGHLDRDSGNTAGLGRTDDWQEVAESVAKAELAYYRKLNSGRRPGEANPGMAKPEPAWDSAEMAEKPMAEQLAAEQAAEGPDHGLSRTNGELAAERAEGRDDDDPVECPECHGLGGWPATDVGQYNAPIGTEVDCKRCDGLGEIPGGVMKRQAAHGQILFPEANLACYKSHTVDPQVKEKRNPTPARDPLDFCSIDDLPTWCSDDDGRDAS